MCAIARWIVKDTLIVWVALGVVVILVLGITQFFPGTLDDRIRYSGMALELLGVFTVALGIREKRRLFGRPSFLEHFKKWFSQHPRWPTKTDLRMPALSGSVGITGGASVSCGRGVAKGASLEDRVTAIEARLDDQEEKQMNMESELSDETQNRIDAINSERQERESAVGSLQTQLDTFGAGNLNLEIIGIFWLVLGLVFATISSEIAWAFT